MRVALLAMWMALPMLLGGCVTTEIALYAKGKSERPVISVRRGNFMRVGQGALSVTLNGEELEALDPGLKGVARVRIIVFGSEEAMSEELERSWAELNKTGRFAIAGAAIGSIAGNPAGGAAAGAAAAQVDTAIKSLTGDSNEEAGGVVAGTVEILKEVLKEDPGGEE